MEPMPARCSTTGKMTIRFVSRARREDAGLGQRRRGDRRGHRLWRRGRLPGDARSGEAWAEIRSIGHEPRDRRTGRALGTGGFYAAD